MRARDLASCGGGTRASCSAASGSSKTSASFGPASAGAWTLTEGWQDPCARSASGATSSRGCTTSPAATSAATAWAASQTLGAPIEGVVRGKGLHDELTGDLFAAVETVAGDTHYVRLDSSSAGSRPATSFASTPSTSHGSSPPTRSSPGRGGGGGVYDPKDISHS